MGKGVEKPNILQEKKEKRHLHPLNLLMRLPFLLNKFYFEYFIVMVFKSFTFMIDSH